MEADVKTPGQVWVLVGELTSVRRRGAKEAHDSLVQTLSSTKFEHEKLLSLSQLDLGPTYHFRGSLDPCVAFIDLANKAHDVLKQMHEYRRVLPQVIFILYCTQPEFDEFRNALPTSAAEQFLHFFRLSKSDDGDIITSA